MDIEDAKSAGGRKERAPGVADLVGVYRFPEKKWTVVRVRRLGLYTKGMYWIKTVKADGSKTKFPMEAPSYDPETQERDSTKVDPWRDYNQYEFEKLGKEGRDKMKVQFQKENWIQIMVRSKQKLMKGSPRPTAKERKTGFKDKDSETLTPVFAFKAPQTFLNQLNEQKELNVHKTKGGMKAFALNDDKFGCDVRVYYDGSKSPAEQYKVMMIEGKTPLTEEELGYLTWNLSEATKVEQPEDKEEQKKRDKEILADFASWAKRNKVDFKVGGKSKSRDDDDEEESDDDEDTPKSKKASKKPVPKSKAKSKKDDDEDFDDDEESDDEDDDEEPAPKKSKKPVKKSSKASDDEEDDFDDDDDGDSEDDEEDEDDAPPKKSAKKHVKKAPAKKSKSDDDEDDDFDDEEDEDEDDEPPAKSKKKAPAKKSKKDEDEDEDDDFDDEDDDDEDEEEDEPPAKKKKVVKKTPAKKSAKKKADDDDEDDDFDDEDEDEDD